MPSIVFANTTSAQPLRPDLLGPEVPLAAVAGLCLLAGAAWWLLHKWRARLFQGFLLGLAGFVARLFAGAVCLWAGYQVAARFLALESNWQLWGHAFLGSFALEIITMLYRWEQTLVSPRLGKCLLALRLGALGCLLAMLLQPVFVRETKLEKRREVVILLDDSASMHLSDPQMTVPEKLALADFMGVSEVQTRPLLANAMRRMAELNQQCSSLSQALDLPEDFSPEVAQDTMTKRLDEIKKLRAEIGTSATQLLEGLNEEKRAFSGEIREQMSTFRRQVEGSLQESLRDWEKELERGNQTRPFSLRNAIRRTQGQLDQLAMRGGQLQINSDAAFYEKLPEATRQTLDSLGTKTRSSIAREALEKPREALPENASLLAALQEKYGSARIIRFGSETAELANLAALPPSQASPELLVQDPLRNRSDLTAALREIDEEFDENSLAGVLLVSDARHNGDLPVDDAARNLGRKGAPVCTLLVGSERGVRDAAVLSVAAPQTIFEGDKLRARVEVKADGLRGEKLAVTLLENGQVVATETVVASDDIFRTTVRLAHQPKAVGIFDYQIKIAAATGEHFQNNNEWGFRVAVSDDRTNVLLVDQTPRWEFRYLRNLFDSRDKSVHLQYVLLEPDKLEGASADKKLATASAKFGESEATHLPETLEEWMKFDVIILGDVVPAALGQQVWDDIKKCVEDRGATLIVMAGPHAMPHAHTAATFQEMCPVVYQPDTKARMSGPEEAFRLELTGAGRGHVAFQQSAGALENAEIWRPCPCCTGGTL